MAGLITSIFPEITFFCGLEVFPLKNIVSWYTAIITIILGKKALLTKISPSEYLSPGERTIVAAL